MPGDETITTAHLEMIASGVLVDKVILERVAADPTLSAELEQIRRDNELMSEFVSLDPHTPDHEFDPITGYELLEEIHRGGQGIVQRARQRSADRMVAIKTLLQGAFASDSQRHRFEREVRLIARLNHPSIVTVHESGRTPMGSHYIVMELVDGVPVDQYCEPLRHAGDLRGIVRVFTAITEAVRYAHQRGVIHRDLKPGNILVSASGQPHILDFGIARAFGNDTQAEPLATKTGEFVGTLSFASPEQIASDPDLVDVRSDVYALGVLLYQALTGERPIDVTGALAEVIARIATEPPAAPSSHNAAIDTDLDTITLTALEKRVTDRYQTAGELHRDLENWLQGRAISARAHDFWYVARKTLRRHRVPVGIGAVFLVLVIGFSITTGILSFNLQRENKTLNGTVRGLGGALRAIDSETTPTPVRDLNQFLSQLVENIQSEVGDRSDVESAVREAAGIAYLDAPSSNYAEADFQLNRAYVLRLQSLTAPHPDLAASLHNLGRLRFKQRRFTEAETYYRQALAMREALFGKEHADVAWTMHHLAFTLQIQGRRDEALPFWTEALRIRRAVLNPGDINIANTLSGLATNHLARGDSASAAAVLRAALDIIHDDPDYGPDSLPVGRVKHNLGVAFDNLGAFGDSEQVLQDVVRIKNLSEPGSMQLARSHIALARTLLHLRRFDDAARELQLALAIQENLEIPINREPDAAILLAQIGLAQGDKDAANSQIDSVIDALAYADSPDPGSVGEAQSIRALIVAADGDINGAIEIAVAADAWFASVRTDRDPRVLENLKRLGDWYTQQQRSAEAAEIDARIEAASRPLAMPTEKHQP